MSASNQSETTTVLLLILGGILVLPLLMMAFGGMMGHAGLMGQYGGTAGWWPVAGMLVPLVSLLVILGGGYLVVQRLSDHGTSRTPAMEELRMAYARGDLTEEEFESRRDRLEGPE